MKIIHLVLGKANPQRMNGVSKVAHYHAVYQHKLGMDVQIWGITPTPESPIVLRDVPTVLFKSQPVFSSPDQRLLSSINTLPSDTIFHIHGALIPEFYKIARVLKEKGLRYIYTPHGAFNKIALKKKPDHQGYIYKQF